MMEAHSALEGAAPVGARHEARSCLALVAGWLAAPAIYVLILFSGGFENEFLAAAPFSFLVPGACAATGLATGTPDGVGRALGTGLLVGTLMVALPILIVTVVFVAAG